MEMLDRKVGALGRRNCSYHQVLAANILGAVRSLSLSLVLLEAGNTWQSCSSLTNLPRLVNLVSTFKQCRRFIKKNVWLIFDVTVRSFWFGQSFLRGEKWSNNKDLESSFRDLTCSFTPHFKIPRSSHCNHEWTPYSSRFYKSRYSRR